MSEHYERTLEIERGALDLETGAFPMTLATDGEASDGHVLSIQGAVTPRDVPLLTSHFNDPTAVLGRVSEFAKEDHRLRAEGRINLTDDGTWLAETRRGIATLINAGDINGVSVRWDGIKSVRRVNLPSDHPAFAKDTDSGPARFGMFFEKWRVLEGSIVALGADPAALIGRSDDCKTEPARTFFRALARSVESRGDGLADVSAAFGAIGMACNTLRELGAEDADIVNAVQSIADLKDATLVPVHYGDGHKIFLPREAWEQLRGESLREYREALSLTRQSNEARDLDDAEPRGEVEDLEASPAGNGAAPKRLTMAETEPSEFARDVATQLGDVLRKEIGTLTGKVRTV